MSEDDRNYFRKRAAQERKAVEQALDPAAANVHKALAARYSILAEDPAAFQAPGEAATPE
jgi:hypothetical protein